MGVDPSPARVAFLRAWAACEGGDARWNPMNTTLRLPGSTSYNRAGVQHYLDALHGLSATLLTLRLPSYTAIREALHAPHLTAHQIAERSHHALITWGTNPTCVIDRLS